MHICGHILYVQRVSLLVVMPPPGDLPGVKGWYPSTAHWAGHRPCRVQQGLPASALSHMLLLTSPRWPAGALWA